MNDTLRQPETFKLGWQAGLIAAIGLISLMLMGPSVKLIAPYLVPHEQVNFLDIEKGSQIHRAVSGDSVHEFGQQWGELQVGSRQFNMVFEIDRRRDAIPVRDYALYIPFAGGPFDIYVNGIAMAESQAGNITAHGFGHHYVFVEIPDTNFQPGINRVTIVLISNEARAGLKGFYFGPAVKLRPSFMRHMQWVRHHNQILLIAGALLFFGSIFAALTKYKLWICALISLMGVLFVAQSGFISNFGDGNLSLGYLKLSRGLIFTKIFAIILIAYNRRPVIRSGNSIETGVLLIAFIAIAIAVLPMIVPSFQLGYSRMTLLNLGVLPLLLHLIYHNFSSRFGTIGDRSEELKSLVMAKELALQEKEMELQKQIRVSAILEERQRLTRDMHDGIGGQLLSLLVRVRGGKIGIEEIEEEVQNGINDLRLIVDSMDNTENNLSTALATFRTRAKAQLDAVGMELVWNQSDTLHIKENNTRAVLNIYRLLQEAVSNAIRHSKAKNLLLEFTQENETTPLEIYIADDGVGIDLVQTSYAGKGIANMKSRTKKMGGTIEFGSGIARKGLGIKLLLFADQDAASKQTT